MKWIFKKFVFLLINNLKRTKNGLDFLLWVCLKEELKDIIRKYPDCPFSENIHIEKVLHLLKNKNTHKLRIIDVGAAKGDMTNYLFQNLPNTIIYAFEPISSNYNLLKQRFRNNDSVFIRNCALGNRIGKDEITITANIGSSSLCEPSTKSDSFYKNNIKEIKKEEIVLSTLDTEIQGDDAIALLKLDVQGYELEVLKGGGKVLERTGIVLIEMLNHSNYTGSAYYFELDEFLRTKGFKLLDIIPSIKDGVRLKEWDGIYINERFEFDF